MSPQEKFDYPYKVTLDRQSNSKYETWITSVSSLAFNSQSIITYSFFSHTRTERKTTPEQEHQSRLCYKYVSAHFIKVILYSIHT